jgi:hypothetical protein
MGAPLLLGAPIHSMDAGEEGKFARLDRAALDAGGLGHGLAARLSCLARVCSTSRAMPRHSKMWPHAAPDPEIGSGRRREW